MSSYFDCIINNIYLQYLPLKYLKMYSINSPAPLCLKLCLLRIDSFQSFLLGRGLRPINNLRVITNTTQHLVLTHNLRAAFAECRNIRSLCQASLDFALLHLVRGHFSNVRINKKNHMEFHASMIPYDSFYLSKRLTKSLRVYFI